MIARSGGAAQIEGTLPEGERGDGRPEKPRGDCINLNGKCDNSSRGGGTQRFLMKGTALEGANPFMFGFP